METNQFNVDLECDFESNNVKIEPVFETQSILRTVSSHCKSDSKSEKSTRFIEPAKSEEKNCSCGFCKMLFITEMQFIQLLNQSPRSTNSKIDSVSSSVQPKPVFNSSCTFKVALKQLSNIPLFEQNQLEQGNFCDYAENKSFYTTDTIKNIN